MLRPHLLLGRKTLLNVPDMGRSSHERKYLLTRLSRFSDNNNNTTNFYTGLALQRFCCYQCVS